MFLIFTALSSETSDNTAVLTPMHCNERPGETGVGNTAMAAIIQPVPSLSWVPQGWGEASYIYKVGGIYVVAVVIYALIALHNHLSDNNKRYPWRYLNIVHSGRRGQSGSKPR